MTIEALLTEQNDLLREFLARFTAPEVSTKDEKPKAGKPASTPVASTPATVEPEPAATSLSEPTKAVTYEDAKLAVTAVVKAKGRDGGLAVLATFDTESLLNVPADKWPSVIAACEKALA